LSQAFLVYIRPQVIEWTNNMSSDMIRLNSFTDASGGFDMAEPRYRQSPTTPDQWSRYLFTGYSNNAGGTKKYHCGRGIPPL
jgi:hypothetical protein